jgi:hypothetical protein
VQLTLRRGGRVHHFHVCTAGAQAEIDIARALGARVLAPGESLDLATAGVNSRHLLVCQPGDLRRAAVPTAGARV